MLAEQKKERKKRNLPEARDADASPVCPSTPAFKFVIPGIGVGNNADGGCSLLVLVVAWVETVKMQCVRKGSVDLNQSHVMCEGQAEITSVKKNILRDLCVHLSHHITQHTGTTTTAMSTMMMMPNDGRDRGKKGWRR